MAIHAELASELTAFVRVTFINLVLAGDNAVAVGMVAATVPSPQRRQVIVWGIAAAVVLRILLTIVATQLLKVIVVTLLGGLLLAFVAYQMYRELRGGSLAALPPDGPAHGPHGEQTVSMALAITQVTVADLSMSLDNVLAVAGTARDHLLALSAGLVLSIVLMAVAANLIASLILQQRWLAWAGVGIIAYVAGGMILQGTQEIAAALS
jgi:YjbE family integral membrane protein